MSDTPETEASVESAEPPHVEHWTDVVERHLSEDFGAAIRVLKDILHRIEQKVGG